MSQIEKSLTDSISSLHDKFREDKALSSFEEASKMFEELVQNGQAKRRGYNLMTLDEILHRSIEFNAPLK